MESTSTDLKKTKKITNGVKMNIFVLAHINAYDDGIPCYGAINLFTSRQKALDWLAKEYEGEYDNVEDLLISDEDRACGEPTGWTIWEEEVN